MRDIKKYDVFKLAHEMVLKVYEETKKFPREEQYGLTNQMRRAAYSIPLNLIEGGARDSVGEFKHFVNISIGSCSELEYLIELSKDLRYLSVDTFAELSEHCLRIKKTLVRLFKKLKE